MKKLVLAAALATMPCSAMADRIDLSTTTCEQFLKSDQTEMMLTLAWLDAYYKDEDAPPVIDTEKFVANAEKLGGYCAANPSIGLITATDELFGE